MPLLTIFLVIFFFIRTLLFYLFQINHEKHGFYSKIICIYSRLCRGIQSCQMPTLGANFLFQNKHCSTHMVKLSYLWCVFPKAPENEREYQDTWPSDLYLWVTSQNGYQAVQNLLIWKHFIISYNIKLFLLTFHYHKSWVHIGNFKQFDI